MTETKRTTAMKLTEWKELYADNAEFVEYCDNELAKLAKKNEKAKERAAEKRAIGDELQASVLAVITDAPQTRDDILVALNDETGELTVHKIQAKLNNLVESNQISKCKVKTEDGKTKTAYVIGAADAE
jgi:predicted transcriptional regulator